MKKPRQGCVDVVDVTMLDVSESTVRDDTKKCTKKVVKSLHLPSKAADHIVKFRREKHLTIETKDLGQEKTDLDNQKTALPSSTNKKRRRRSAAEIDRKYKCPFAGCLKAYGSEGSLIHHQKLKHPERVDCYDKDNQVGTFLLPLTNPPRNVMIRPATPLAFATDQMLLLSKQSSTNDINPRALLPLDIVPPLAKAPRCSVRSRSESDSVASIEKQPQAKASIPTATLMTKPGPKQILRNSCRVITPHPKKATVAARHTKLRSKSESLLEINPLQPFDNLTIPSYHRNDSFGSVQETILPFSSAGSVEHGSFEWPATLILASGHHSTSLSSDEQAIDSDILSVLANCDEETTDDPVISDFGRGSSSTNLSQSSSNFGTIESRDLLPVGMECFDIAENATISTQVSQEFVMNEPEAELGMKAFTPLGDDWTNAMLLSDHLKKMSMAQEDTPPHSLVSTFGKVIPNEGIVHRLRSASDPVHVADPVLPELTRLSPVHMDTYSVTKVDRQREDSELLGPNNTNFQQRSGSSSTSDFAKLEEDGIQKMFWLSGGAAAAATVSNLQPSSEVLDQLLQHDDTLEWKPSDLFEDDKEIDYSLSSTGTTLPLL